MKIYELTRSQLQELRSEIVLNSLFLKDYENSLGIEPKEAYSFFDGYVDYLYELVDKNDKGARAYDIFDVVMAKDNLNNLYDYFCMVTY